MRVPALAFLACCSFTACASAPSDAPARAAGAPSSDATSASESGRDGAPASASAPVSKPASGEAEPSGSASAPPASFPGELELAIWKDPGFQRRFTESYIAETEVEPRLTLEEREKLQKILELISADKGKEALELLEKARGPAASAVYDFTLGNMYFQQDKFTDAAAAYRISVEKYPKFRRAWKKLGEIHLRRAEHAEARAALSRAIELGANDAFTYGFLGFSHLSLEDYVAAESAYRMANLLDPATLNWKMSLAWSLFKQERHADAIALAQVLIEEQPDKAELWLLQANSYAALGQTQKAAENFEIVNRLGKATPDSLNTLGDIYVNQELYSLAVDAYVQAMEKDTAANPARAIRAAKALAARRANEETRRLVDRVEALAAERLSEDARKDLLKIRVRLAASEDAGEEEARLLEEIVRLDPLDGDALIDLGRYYRRSGDTEKAILRFEQAAGIERSEADAKLAHAQVLVSQRKYAEALPLIRRAQTLKPREALVSYLEQVERAAQSR